MLKQSLNGVWELRGGSGDRGGIGRFPHFENPERFMKAGVPGSVHETLIKEKIIKEPTLGKNVLESRWIEEWVWGYRRTFDLNKSDIKDKKVRIVFECLDLTSVIYINGKEAGRHNNYYYPCRLDITNLVSPGENNIFVRIESGLIWAADKPALPYYGAISNDAAKLSKRMWLRKPQCSFEWDWSPRLINVGIPGDVYLEFGDVFVDETAVLSNVSDDYSNAEIEVRVFTENLCGEAKNYTCRVTQPPPSADGTPFTEGGNEETSESLESPLLRRGCHEVTGVVTPGKSHLSCKFNINNPKLWNPIGFGEQFRYNIKVELLDENNNLIYEEIIKHGVRKAIIDQSKHPTKGTYFILTVNGNKIFAKGGNFVPADIVYSRITRKDYEILIDRAIEANCNAMRVWGGGMYESDDFYDLCDEKGLIVWQDFIGACSSYPSNNNEFFENYRQEIIYQIRRMSRYASPVIYSGNNEIEWQVWNPMSGDRFPDANLYHWILPRTLKEEDPYKYYQPSSPWSPDFEYPNADHTGDQHPWHIGFNNFNFFEYRDCECRFPNEGGLRGPNSLPAMKACFENGEDYMHSFSWQVHENSIDDWGNTSADIMFKDWLNIDPMSISVEKYVYLGGFVQGDGLSEYILNFRRRKFDTASAIFWMYNDCWPTTRSWTIIDYYRNRTPAFYPVKRAFNPLAVDIVCENNKLSVYGISDLKSDAKVNIEYGIFTPDGKYLEKKSKEIIIKTNASDIIAEIDFDLWQKTGSTKCLPYAILYVDGKIVSSRRFINTIYYDLELVKNPVISKRTDEKSGKVYLKSDVFILGASIDLDGKQVSDNFFDLFPGVEKEFDISEIDGIKINTVNINL
ncbi:MAG: hypothetical protein FWF92_06995 [Oscillospiraceae bacterium]|nr:hypothetical protein [Oscillospiraceae bacterium]